MTDRPRYWKCRLAKHGPFVGVKTFFGPPFVDDEELDRSPRLQALVHTDRTARAVTMTGVDDVPVEVHGVTLRNIEPIKEHEYRYLVAHSAWAEEYKPDRPEANATEPVDFNKIIPI